MEQRRLGRTGLSVSAIGFGMEPAGAANYLEPWDPHDPGAQRNVLEALAAAEDEGCNLVEVSPAYGDGLAEELLGRFLPDRRGRWVVVASVCPPPLGWGRLSAEYVLRSVEASLKRLRIDSVDVLQFHGDWWRRTDYRALVDDGMPALSRLRKEGKIRFTGISSEEPEHLVAYVKSGLFDVIQIRYNILYQGAYHQVLPLARQHDVGVLAMRPLTSGLLARIAATSGLAASPADLADHALRFVLSDRRVASAVIGMRSAAEVAANARVVRSPVRWNLKELHDERAREDRAPLDAAGRAL